VKALGGGWKIKGQEKKEGAKRTEAERGIGPMQIRPGKAKKERKKSGERGGRRLSQFRVLSPDCWSYWEYCTGSG